MVLGGFAVLGFALWPPLSAHLWPPPDPALTSTATAWPYPYKIGRDNSTEKEIAFYQKRLRERTVSAPDQAALASAYLRQARRTMDPSWYLLAEKSALESLSHQPVGNRMALLILARVAEARHDFAQALERVARVGAENDDTMAIQATSYLAMGDVPHAAEAARKLIRAAPAAANYGLLALVEIAQGHDDVAADDFRKTLSREEMGEQYSSAWLRVMLGRFSFRRGHLAMARALYDEALRIMPDYPLAQAQLAELQAASGDYVGADRNYDRAYTTAQLPAWLLARANVQQALGNSSAAHDLREEARQTLEPQIRNGAFGHRRDLARLYLDRGQAGDAARAVELMRAEVRNRHDAETMDVLAQALLADGQPAEALKAEQEGLRYGIRDAAMQLHLAAIQRKLGNEEAARQAEAEARAIDPLWKP